MQKIKTDYLKDLSEKVEQVNKLYSSFQCPIWSAKKSQRLIEQMQDEIYKINLSIPALTDAILQDIEDCKKIKMLLECSESDLFCARQPVSKSIPFSQNLDTPKRFTWDLPQGFIGSGVYLIWEKDELIYIGMSDDCNTRIRQHIAGKNSKNKNATHAAVFKLDYHYCHNVEVALIKKFQPKNNIFHK